MLKFWIRSLRTIIGNKEWERKQLLVEWENERYSPTYSLVAERNARSRRLAHEERRSPRAEARNASMIHAPVSTCTRCSIMENMLSL